MKQFNKAQVIILPTNQPNTIWIDNDINQLIHGIYSVDGIHNCKNQHLYIISDDEIKEGDWIYNELSGIGKYIKNEEFNNGIVVIYNNQGFEVAEDIKNVKKIIATTDTSLYTEKESWFSSSKSFTDNKVKILLPQPSQQFIEEYIESHNKREIITDVLVEYEEYAYEPIIGKFPDYKANPNPRLVKIKVNPDNTITIKK